jgi:hypothetical protein
VDAIFHDRDLCKPIGSWGSRLRLG